MKKHLSLALAGLALHGQSHAQSSVTLFGLMDAGISYVSNEGGHSNTKFDDGIFMPNLFGMVGSEDLGGGTKAIFRLVSQFSLANGATIGGGLFARTAYVGLEDDHFGTVTLGNQYEFMSDALFGAGNDAARDVGGLYNLRNGPFQKLALPNNPTGAFDWDRTGGSQRMSNSVKYLSPVLAGLRIGAMYVFGGVPGSIGANNAASFGINYDLGAFGVAAAYTNQKYGAVTGAPATSVQNWGAGAHYKLGNLTTNALFTTVRNSASGGAAWMAELGGIWQFTPSLMLGADYVYMKGNENLDNNHAHQITAALDYWLSKRTMVYVSGIYQRANSGAHAQINGILDPNGASSSATQAIARVGLSTRF
ncbi:porin (plasmid) [Burkholderia sp. SFA1]|nr:porin [Burkholderia sp. SFA1]